MRSSFLAQGYNVGVTTALQLATTPMLLTSWGIDQVGSWMVVSAVAANFVLSELGSTYVAKTEMVMGFAGQDVIRAEESFRTASAVVLFGNAVVLAVLLCLFLCWPGSLHTVVGVSAAAHIEVAFLLLAVNAVLQTHTLLICAGQRTAYSPAVETVFSTTIRLAEFAALFLMSRKSGDPAIAAAAMCLVRGVANTAGYFVLRRVRYCHVGWPSRGIHSILRMAPPALAYLLMPLAQAMLLQVPVVVIGALLSPKEVVQFVAMRTVARIGTTLMNMINNTTGPEYSRLFGAGLSAELSALLRKHLRSLVLLSALVLVGGIVLGGYGVRLLTHQKVEIQFWPFVVMLVGVVAEMTWTAIFTPIAAANQHTALAVRVLFASCVSAVLLYPLTSMEGLLGTALALLGAQLLAIALGVSAVKHFGHHFESTPFLAT